MSRTPPAVALVGYGHWGRNVARNLAGLGALAAICESAPASAAAAAAAHPETPVTADLDAILADNAIDAVALVTPAATHGALARRAIEAGKHVFVEKPLCLDPEEGRAVAELADARGRILMVGHLLLYHPAFRALCAAVEGGQLGALRYIYSNRLSLGRIRREENALWSFAPHDISMILWLTGSAPERVLCTGGSWLSPDIADSTLSHLTFPGGVQAHIFVSWLHPYKDHRMVVIGADAMAVFDDTRAGAQKLRLYRHRVGWNGEVPDISRAEAEPIPYDYAEPLHQEVSHFLDCVAQGTRPRSDATEALRVLEVLRACQVSLGDGRPVFPGGACV